ncbi:MAG: alkaline phosphatase [Tissierellia bacterium]|nr:alkaline phosphatase [Tissierellia bacterium]
MKKRLLAAVLAFAMMLAIFSGCAQSPAPAESTETTEAAKAETTETAAETEAAKTEKPATEEATETAKEAATKPPKYIFMLIGDGMSAVQINSAQVFNGNSKDGEIATKNLLFADFPACGMATTHDSTSFCPDSASTATSMSTGYKTHSGVIGMAVDKTTPVTNIAELMKDEGKKVGIVSTVTINHATPAAYYAHVESRNDYYGIAMQMADSGVDYFAGGEISKPTGNDKDQKDAYEILEEKGYTIARTADEIAALNASSGKAYAVSPSIQDSGAMPYAIDQKEGDLSLADFVEKGIEVLDNDEGFFLMAESGKIDWSCHANDAMTTITEVLDFEKAVQVAYDFAQEHPDETLIIVTGDHETGGMTIGYASTGYDTAFNIMGNQKMSYVEFDQTVKDMKEANPELAFEDVAPLITETFGLKMPTGDAAADEADPLVLTEFEVEKLQAGFAESMLPVENREETEANALLYGTYDPLSVSITHIANNKSGVGWTSYAHTGVPVPVYAYGVGADQFNGYYDNTDVFYKISDICEITGR